MRSVAVCVMLSIGCGGPETPPPKSHDVKVRLFPPIGGITRSTRIVIVGPSGDLQETAATPGTTITATIEDGSSVTAVMQLSDSAYAIDTTLDVNGGDEIALGVETMDNTVLGTFTVEWPPGQTGSVTVVHPCGAKSLPAMTTRLTFDVKQGCKTDPLDLIIYTSNAEAPLRYIHATAPFTPGGSIVLTEPFRDGTLFDATLRNLDRWSPEQGTPLRYMPSYLGIGFSDGQPEPMATTATMITSLQGGDTNRLYQRVIDVVDGTSASYDLDVAAAVLGIPDRISIDVNTKTVSVLSDNALEGDALDMLLQYGYWPDPHVEWTIRGAIKADATFTLPPVGEVLLPKKARQGYPCDYLLTGSCYLLVGLQDSSEMDGYDDFKAHPTYVDLPFPIIYPPGTRLRRSTREIQFE